jgi:acyl-CoA reductase-like NAD-dependent aldehyde dehydrogenase
MSNIFCRNPRTGEILREIPKTPIDSLAQVFDRAHRAQQLWSKTPLKQRIRKMAHLREVLCYRLNEMAKTIHQENGKPETEALACELVPSLEMISYYIDIAPKKLKPREVRFRNPFMNYRKSTVIHQPMGVIAVISPWNYPFFLAFGDIVAALISGNSVVFKPSEHTSLIAMKMHDLFEEAGFPMDVLQTVYGEGDLGSAMIEHRPAKISFTGSVATGKSIMKQAANHLIPVCLELGGKDAMIVLPDADLDYASSAALWGGFTNSGQVCASTERLIVHESVMEQFVALLKTKLSKLTVDSDLGVCTMEKQKSVYESHLADAKGRNLEFLCGGALSEDRTRMIPTLVIGPEIEESRIYNEETFGPVIAITSFKSVREAIDKANRSPYGLLASVITQNISLGEEIASELQVGTVMINEVIYTAGIPETPWGGMKDSGFGRKHSENGLYEFTHQKHVNRPRFGFLVFKSWWWYPYSNYQKQFFQAWGDMYGGGILEKMFKLPHLLWTMLQFLKNEPRI